MAGNVAQVSCAAQVNVLTWHNDNARTGQNLSEALLTPANVNKTDFGLLANVTVDGKVDAQPLYVSALVIPNVGTRNVIFVATEHDSVYAIDADHGYLYWKKTMLASGEVPSDSHNCDQVVPEIGITSTPVTNRGIGAHGVIYLVALSKTSAGAYVHRIHALDLATGAEMLSGPKVVSATYPGTGAGSSNGVVTFDPKMYKERPALLLVNGLLVTAWGSHCDFQPYGGWMMTYNQNTLAQVAVIDFVPNGSDGAPWNAGAGPAADAAGNLYISLGNGTFDTTLTSSGFPNKADYGNSVVKLSPANNKLTVLDYWTMSNTKSESGGDVDLGSGGYMLLPDMTDATGKVRHLSVAAGKDSNMYIVDRDKMGHFDAASDATIYQQLTGALPGGIWSAPAYFNGHIYYGSVTSKLRSFDLKSARVASSPSSGSSESFAYPGAFPSVSAYGSANGIVWAHENSNPAILHAYSASNLADELYSSEQSGTRDQFGTGNKFIAPMIANGKVYVGTTKSVAIFGMIRFSGPLVADGIYSLINQKSALLLDVPGGAKASGSALAQEPTSGLNEQKWFISFNGRGYYTVQNVASGLFLSDPNLKAAPGTATVQASPDWSDGQLWALNRLNGVFQLKNKRTGMVVDDLGGSTSAGAHIGFAAAGTGTDQTWKLQ